MTTGFLFQLASSLGPALLIPQPWFWQEKLSVGAPGGSSALQAWKSIRVWAKHISAGGVFLLNGIKWPCFAQGSFPQKCCFFRKFIPAAQGSPRQMLGFIPNPVGGWRGFSSSFAPCFACCCNQGRFTKRDQVIRLLLECAHSRPQDRELLSKPFLPSSLLSGFACRT